MAQINLSDALEKFGTVLSFGFGDSVVVGALFAFIEDTSPMELYKAIIANTDLTAGVSNEDWQTMRQFASKINLNDVDTNRVVKELKQNRLDLLNIIVNTPGGMVWLDSQINKARSKITGRP